MKFFLNLLFLVLVIAKICANSFEENTFDSLSQKEKIRTTLVRSLVRNARGGMQSQCPREYLPEEILFDNQKIEEFVQCSNATIDTFINNLDDKINYDEIETSNQAIRLFVEPVCKTFNEMFSCIREFGPAIDVCLNASQKIYKNNLFAIAPLIHQSVCLRNGTLMAKIAEHNDDSNTCAMSILNTMVEINVIQLLESESTNLFDNAIACNTFKELLQMFYDKITNCSIDALEQVKIILGFFCEATQCIRYVPDLQCY